MKLLALLAALTFLPLLLTEAAPPALPIDQALKLAQDYLLGRGLAEAHPVESLTLEKGTVFGGEMYWLARWDPAIRTDDKAETSLRINMDGTMVLFTTGGPKGRRPVKNRYTR